METGYSLLLPEGVLNYFKVIFVENAALHVIIHLEELNLNPGEYKSHDLESKGFYPNNPLGDFPLRGKAMILHVQRLRWTNRITDNIVSPDSDLVAYVICLMQEFASFFK